MLHHHHNPWRWPVWLKSLLALILGGIWLVAAIRTLLGMP